MYSSDILLMIVIKHNISFTYIACMYLIYGFVLHKIDIIRTTNFILCAYVFMPIFLLSFQ